ncbi:hypothetical protein B0H14DRAFT_2643183 [Mycena olivaceomarginata]|nr:hypothetical protein B0H14DRAFT_2643183 [Mycena olivaceomarginata]
MTSQPHSHICCRILAVPLSAGAYRYSRKQLPTNFPCMFLTRLIWLAYRPARNSSNGDANIRVHTLMAYRDTIIFYSVYLQAFAHPSSYAPLIFFFAWRVVDVYSIQFDSGISPDGS